MMTAGFTEAGMNHILQGKCADGFLRGRVGVRLLEIQSEEVASFQFVLVDADNKTLFEFDPTTIRPEDNMILGTPGQVSDIAVPVEFG